MPPAPADELPRAPGPDRDWQESWTFETATADGHLGAWVRFTRVRDHARYEAVVAGEHRQVLAVLDPDVPFRSSPLEVRTTGLWADHVCESPLDHWTIGLEAFALGVDDPLELLGRQYGDQVPLGLDLEWETDGPVHDDPPAAGASGYGVPCRVHGEVLLGADAIDLDAPGHRWHRWGAPPPVGWSLAAVVEGGQRWVLQGHGSAARAWVTGPRQPAPVPVVEELALRRDRHGLPRELRVRVDGSALAAEVLAAVPLPGRDGTAGASVALCRLRAGDGRTGIGWLHDTGTSGQVDA